MKARKEQGARRQGKSRTINRQCGEWTAFWRCGAGSQRRGGANDPRERKGRGRLREATSTERASAGGTHTCDLNQRGRKRKRAARVSRGCLIVRGPLREF